MLANVPRAAPRVIRARNSIMATGTGTDTSMSQPALSSGSTSSQCFPSLGVTRKERRNVIFLLLFVCSYALLARSRALRVSILRSMIACPISYTGNITESFEGSKWCNDRDMAIGRAAEVGAIYA